MKIYPAIRAQMGDWNYYIVRMKMREVAHEVNFAHDIYEDYTLSDAIQRTLGERRVRKEIVGYLARRPDRFFSSIVVAATEGEPIWHPVEMDESVPEILKTQRAFKDSFGMLTFGDDAKYYALDGQHRVKAIKLLVSREVDDPIPEGFDNDLLSVIVILREEHDVPEGEWLRRYRRLFSSLNRYAKPTDRDTNIIMDEDDLFAILTRRLITDHIFFQAPGAEKSSHKVKTKGKSLNVRDGHFTTLQVLYAVNEILLKTRNRNNRRWFAKKADFQIRCEEHEIDDFYDELEKYWDVILSVLPVLNNDPVKMRQHRSDHPDRKNESDHLLFWPIGQELFAKLVRSLLDDAFPHDELPDNIDEIKSELYPITQITWELHKAPWRQFLLIRRSDEDNWRMRSEDRKNALEVALRLLRWMANIDNLNSAEIDGLRSDWEELLLYQSADSEFNGNKMWGDVEDIRRKILSAE